MSCSFDQGLSRINGELCGGNILIKNFNNFAGGCKSHSVSPSFAQVAGHFFYKGQYLDRSRFS
jgi:hypothetical protein